MSREFRILALLHAIFYYGVPILAGLAIALVVAAVLGGLP